MKRLYHVNDKYDYIGSSICFDNEEQAVHYAENVNHHGDDYFYYIEKLGDRYIVRFYSFNYKKAYLELIKSKCI